MSNNFKETSKFIRGQIWLWDDPVYGSKEDGNQVHDMEVETRYSRYVLVLQNQNIQSAGVLVAPCSTSISANIHGNIPIGLATSTGGCDTKVIIPSIFPVHPKTLVKYIAAVSEEVMIRVNTEIARYLLPTLMTLPKEQLESIGIDLEWRKGLNESSYTYGKSNSGKVTSGSPSADNPEEKPVDSNPYNDTESAIEINNIQRIPSAISELANCIRDYIGDQFIHCYSDAHLKVIGASAYYSLLYFAGIDSNYIDTSHINERYMKENDLLLTFSFFDKIYSDRSLSGLGLEDLIAEYSRKYTDGKVPCINPGWVECFEKRVIPRLGGPSKINSEMVKKLRGLLCSPAA